MNFNEIRANWKIINGNIEEINIGVFNKIFGGYDVLRLGKQLHSVQDFYAHSNYVELYIEYYRSKNDDNLPALGEIPTYDEVMDNAEKHADFINK